VLLLACSSHIPDCFIVSAAIAGTLFDNQLRANIPSTLPPDIVTQVIGSVEVIKALAEPARSQVIAAYAKSLQPVFIIGVPAGALACLSSLLVSSFAGGVRESSRRTQAHLELQLEGTRQLGGTRRHGLRACVTVGSYTLLFLLFPYVCWVRLRRALYSLHHELVMETQYLRIKWTPNMAVGIVAFMDDRMTCISVQCMPLTRGL
jgi:hypothetical protein